MIGKEKKKTKTSGINQRLHISKILNHKLDENKTSFFYFPRSAFFIFYHLPKNKEVKAAKDANYALLKDIKVIKIEHYRERGCSRESVRHIIATKLRL